MWKAICTMARPRTAECCRQQVTAPTYHSWVPSSDVHWCALSQLVTEHRGRFCCSCGKANLTSATHFRVFKAFFPRLSCALSPIQPQGREQLKYGFCYVLNLHPCSACQIRLKHYWWIFEDCQSICFFFFLLRNHQLNWKTIFQPSRMRVWLQMFQNLPKLVPTSYTIQFNEAIIKYSVCWGCPTYHLSPLFSSKCV